MPWNTGIPWLSLHITLKYKQNFSFSCVLKKDFKLIAHIFRWVYVHVSVHFNNLKMLFFQNSFELSENIATKKHLTF